MNKTIHIGDNLDVMRGLNSDLVDLIYLDPPFNSNRNYSAPIGSQAAGAFFKDTWTLDDVDLAWHGQIAETNPALYSIIESAGLSHSKGMKSYLIMMSVRLIECHRLLKDTGSLYLHCDPTASHYLKLLLDCVFGRSNFRNEIVWGRSSGKGSQFKDKKFGACTDTILFYTKSDTYTFSPYRPFTDDEIKKRYPYIDNNKRYAKAPLYRSKGMGDRPNLCYEYKTFKNPHPSGWRLSKERLKEEIAKGNVIIKDGKIERRRYLKDVEGAKIESLWSDLPIARGVERTGYPTQKPLKLLERIIKASTNEGDLVLDPFCGCATTLVAAEKLGRKWIGIDLSEKAGDLIHTRAHKELGIMSAGFNIQTTLPKRTDQGKLAPYKTHKHTLYGKQEGYCGGCARFFEFRNLTVDHIIPQSKSGTDHFENLQLLCGACNSMKGAGTQEELIARLKELKILR